MPTSQQLVFPVLRKATFYTTSSQSIVGLLLAQSTIVVDGGTLEVVQAALPATSTKNIAKYTTIIAISWLKTYEANQNN